MKVVHRYPRAINLAVVVGLVAVIVIRHIDGATCPKHGVVLYRDGLFSGRRYCPVGTCSHESTREYRQSLRQELSDQF